LGSLEGEDVQSRKQHGIANVGRSVEKKDVSIFEAVEDGPHKKKHEFEEEVVLWEGHPHIKDQPGGRR
jgi:hypothetical protein